MRVLREIESSHLEDLAQSLQDDRARTRKLSWIMLTHSLRSKRLLEFGMCPFEITNGFMPVS